MKNKPDAKNQALRFLEVMDRTESELRKKLKDKDYSDDEVNEAIDFVKSYNYINDERYARIYIESSRNKKSRKKIEYDLRGKGLTKEVILGAFEDCEPFSETELIEKLAQKKLGSEMPDYMKLQKVKSYLAGKGFCLSDINEVLSKYLT